MYSIKNICITLSAAALSQYLQGCHHDDDTPIGPLHPIPHPNPQNGFKCRGDKVWDMKMMAGCWKGIFTFFWKFQCFFDNVFLPCFQYISIQLIIYIFKICFFHPSQYSTGNTTDQDFFLNFLYREDQDGKNPHLSADFVWGPHGKKGPLGDVQVGLPVDFEINSNGQNATLAISNVQSNSDENHDFNFKAVSADDDKVGNADLLCSQFRSKDMWMEQVQCHRVCSVDQLAGTWHGTNKVAGARNFTIVLDKSTMNGGTGTWTMDNGKGPHPINWTYAFKTPDSQFPAPDLGITIEGDHYLKDSKTFTHFVSELKDKTKEDSFSCLNFVGQKGFAGPAIAGVNMELVKQEDESETEKLAMQAQADSWLGKGEKDGDQEM